MKYLIDNNLPHRLAKALNALEVDNEVYHLTDKFAADAKDIDWLPKLAAEGDWAVIAADHPKGEHERRAWNDTRLKVFFLATGWRDLTYWPKCAKLIKVWPVITHTASHIRGAHRYQVPVRGEKLISLS